jgi:hypothetical protein
MVLLFQDQFRHKYREKQVVSIVQIVDQDLAQIWLHVELNKTNFIIFI